MSRSLTRPPYPDQCNDSKRISKLGPRAYNQEGLAHGYRMRGPVLWRALHYPGPQAFGLPSAQKDLEEVESTFPGLGGRWVMHEHQGPQLLSQACGTQSVTLSLHPLYRGVS